MFNMKPELAKLLESRFKEHPVLAAGPVSLPEVSLLETYAGFSLPEVYKEFVLNYGGGIVGSFPIYGMRRAHAMALDEESAINVTQKYRLQKSRGIDGWLIISSDLSGSPIGLLPTGEIWISDVEFGVVAPLSPTFESFLVDVCLRGK